MAILDARGRPIGGQDDYDDQSSGFLEIGTTGLKRSGGFIHEEWHRQLRGRQGVRKYVEMRDNNAVIGAMLFAIEMFIRQAETNVLPADEHDNVALEAAAFLEECLDDMKMTWDDTTAEIMSMLPFGWSLFEEVYKLRMGPDQEDKSRRSKFSDGRVGWRKWAIRAQETLWKWEFDDDGDVCGMWQQDPYAQGKGGAQVLIPMQKALLFRTKSHKGNPEGRSVLRNAWRSYRFLKRIQEIEGIGIERDLAGYPVAFVPQEIMLRSATPEQQALRQLMETLVTQVRRDEREGMVFPSPTGIDGNPTGYDFKLMSTGGRRQLDVDKVIRRYEMRIATTLLHDWVLMGQDKVGSLALSNNKTKASDLAVSAYLEQRDEVVNRVAIPRLFRLNPEFPPGSWPTIKHGDIKVPDLSELSEFISKLVTVGVLTPDKGLERHVRQTGELNELEEEPDLTPLRGPQVQVPEQLLLPGEAPGALETGGEGQAELPLPGDGEAEPGREGVAPEAEAIIDPDLALNGAQITALKDIVIAVQAGELPRDSAIELVVAGFPIKRDRVERIIGSGPPAEQSVVEPTVPAPEPGGVVV
jgi:hypothetical protein